MRDLYIDCFEITMASGNKYYLKKEPEDNIDDLIKEHILKCNYCEIQDIKTKKNICIRTQLIETICEVILDTETKEVL